MSNVTSISCKIDGRDFDSVRDLQNFRLKGEFADGKVTANIATTKLSFVNDAARFIRDYIDNGASASSNGIFHGLSVELPLSNDGNRFDAFEGLLDFTDDLEIVTTNEVRANIRQYSGLDSFTERARAVTYGLLVVEGIVQSTDFVDIEYLVEKEESILELILLSIMIYQLSSALADSIRSLAKDIANVVSLATGGFPVTGQVSSIALGIALIVIQLVYTTLLVIALIKMIEQLINSIISPIRYFKGMLLKTLLSRGAQKLGYTFSSTIPELDFLTYLPSQKEDGNNNRNLNVGSGIPNAVDYGYTVFEIYELCKNLFRAELLIEGTTIHLEPIANENFWYRESNYTIPNTFAAADVISEKVKFNTNENFGRKILKFQTDISDEWTIDQFQGTNFEIDTSLNTVTDARLNLVKGFKEVDFRLSLGVRKSELSVLERAIKAFGSVADGIINGLGGNSKFASKVEGRVGMLKITQKFMNNAKLLYLRSGKIPSNNRALLSAKTLYEKYHFIDSFVDQARGQKIIKQANVKFNFGDLQKILTNGFIFTDDGKKAKLIDFDYSPGLSECTLNYSIQKQYDANLTETFIEPS